MSYSTSVLFHMIYLRETSVKRSLIYIYTRFIVLEGNANLPEIFMKKVVFKTGLVIVKLKPAYVNVHECKRRLQEPLA